MQITVGHIFQMHSLRMNNNLNAGLRFQRAVEKFNQFEIKTEKHSILNIAIGGVITKIRNITLSVQC